MTGLITNDFFSFAPVRQMSPALGLLASRARRLYTDLGLSPTGRRVVGGMLWSVTGTGASRATALLASIVVARLLDKTRFGEFGIIQSTVGLFGVLAGMGLGTTASKYVAEFRSADRERAGRVVALSTLSSWMAGALMASALLVFSSLIATKALNAPWLHAQIKISSLLVLLEAVNGAQIGVLSGLESFRMIARINTMTGFLSFACLIAGAYFNGLPGAVWGLVASAAGACLLSSHCIRHELIRHGIAIDWRSSLGELPLLWQFSLPVTLVSLLVVAANWIGYSLLATSSHGYAALAEMTVAFQWRNFVMLIPMLLAGVAIPMLSSLNGAKDRKVYRKLLLAQLAFVGCVAAVAMLGVTVFARWIALSYGPSYVSAIPAIRWMALAGFLIALNSVAASAMFSLGRAWLGLALGALCGGMLITVAWRLVPAAGAEGLSIAHVLAYVGYSICQGMFLWNAFGEDVVVRSNELANT